MLTSVNYLPRRYFHPEIACRRTGDSVSASHTRKTQRAPGTYAKNGGDFL
jgi:hypothetical protein